MKRLIACLFIISISLLSGCGEERVTVSTVVSSTATPIVLTPTPTIIMVLSQIPQSVSTSAAVAITTAAMSPATNTVTPLLTITKGTPSTAPSPTVSVVRKGQVGLGAYYYLKDEKGNVTVVPWDDFKLNDAFEARMNHKMEFVLWFSAIGESDAPFNTKAVKLASQKGLMPVITVEPWKRPLPGVNPNTVQPEYSLPNIAAGKLDAYFTKWAQDAKASGVTLYLRFAHEMATNKGERLWYPWQGDPENYILAWKHVWNIFQKEKATNVLFLWSANWLQSDNTPLYYPGDQYVDAIGTTILNFGTLPGGENKWLTFDELMTPQYDGYLKHWKNKPLFITELGTSNAGGSKAQWIRDTFSSLQPKFPLIRGMLLYEGKDWKDSVTWSVEETQESAQAFRETIQNPWIK